MLVLLASQCYFELNGLYPSAGGDYTFLQQAYGDYAGFAFGFYNFFISKPGSQAIIATIFGRYMNILIVNICGSSSSATSSDNPFGEETTISKVHIYSLLLFKISDFFFIIGVSHRTQHNTNAIELLRAEGEHFSTTNPYFHQNISGNLPVYHGISVY